jgi:hypothetical protein
VSDNRWVRRARAVTTGLVSGALAAGTAAGAPQRDTLLRPGVGIGNARLGMTVAQVRRALGRPDRIVRSTPNGYRHYTEYVWGFDPELRVGLYGRGAQARVDALATTRRERTHSGVGVGSTHRTLRRVLGARCYQPPPNPNGADEQPGYPLQMLCYLGDRGGPATYFRLANHCLIRTDRHVLCPRSKRRYVAYEVQIISPLGQRILGAAEPRRGPWVPVRG